MITYQVRVFDLTDGNGFRCLHQLDVNKLIVRERENKYAAQSEVKTGMFVFSVILLDFLCC